MCVGLAYFLILLGIALWVRDIPGQPDAFRITPQQLTKTGSYGDPQYFATAAIDIAEHGWIHKDNAWILNLWPPGFIVLEASIMKVLGPEAPVILVLQLLAALLFSIVLTLLYEQLSTYMNDMAACTLPLLVFAFPVSRVFLLQPTGIIFGESFSIGFFMAFILLALRSTGQRNLHHAAYAGVCLALSAYFRSQFEIILLALTAWGVLLAGTVHLYRRRNAIDPALATSVVKTVVVVLFVAHAATVPWRVYHRINQKSLSWVQTSSVMFTNAVTSSEELIKKGGGFVVHGAGNLVCRIDPAACDDTANAKKLFIKTFIEHPLKWYSLKYDVIGSYWYSSAENWTNVRIGPTPADFVTNGLLLLALLAAISLLFTRRIRTHVSWLVLIWVALSLVSAYMLIFTAAHFEVRYFYFPKIAGIVMLLIVTGLFCRPPADTGSGNDHSLQTSL